MSSIKKITEAKTTCDGLHRLVRKLNVAAVDLDKSGGSAYELMALLASTHACVNSLGSQLETLASEAGAMEHADTATTNHNIVTPLHRSDNPGFGKADTPATIDNSEAETDMVNEKSLRAIARR